MATETFCIPPMSMKHQNCQVAQEGHSKAMPSKDDQPESAAEWWNLCGRAWTEEDPVKLLEVTMQIIKFLGRKQNRLDAAYDAAFDEAQKLQQAQQARQTAQEKTS